MLGENFVRFRRPGNSAIDLIVLAVLVVSILLWGVTRFATETTSPQEDAAHRHPPGPHGGVIASFADDRLHAEGLIEPDGTLSVFTLGRDETEVLEVQTQTLNAELRNETGEVFAVDLTARPMPGDAEEHTSRFSGRVPSELRDQRLQVTIDGLRIDGRRYRFGFVWGDTDHQPAMPGKVTDEEERRLYLEPGGLYTEADIAANGNQTASQAFASFKAQHDFSPQSGDMLCPVTRTKANPACSWIIGGQAYTFCCPPCVDEFLNLAKTDPDQVSPPEAYIKD